METADTHHFNPNFLRKITHDALPVERNSEDLVALGDHQRRIIELDIREHHRKLKTDMQTADQHNQAHTGRLEFEDKFLRKTPQSRNLYEGGELPANEDLVSEHDYQRRIEELELTIAALRGRVWRAEEERDRLRKKFEI